MRLQGTSLRPQQCCRPAVPRACRQQRRRQQRRRLHCRQSKRCAGRLQARQHCAVDGAGGLESQVGSLTRGSIGDPGRVCGWARAGACAVPAAPAPRPASQRQEPRHAQSHMHLGAHMCPQVAPPVPGMHPPAHRGGTKVGSSVGAGLARRAPVQLAGGSTVPHHRLSLAASVLCHAHFTAWGVPVGWEAAGGDAGRPWCWQA